MSDSNTVPASRSFPAMLATCCAVTFCSYFAVSMRLPVVPLYAAGFGVTTAQIGVINAAFYLVAGMMALPSGFFSDLFGRKRLALTGTAIMGVGMLLLLLGHTFGTLTAIYLLLGGGIAAFGPTMMSWVAAITPATHLGRAYGWYTTALFCGLGLGPAAGGALGDWMAYPSVFALAAALLAVNIAAVAVFLPSTPVSAASRTGHADWLAGAGKVLTNRPLVGCWAASFGACVTAGVFFSFLPLLADRRGLTLSQIGIVFLVQSVTNALSRIPFGMISDRVGQRKFQAMAGVIAVALSITAFAPARSFQQFMIAAVLLGASNAVAFTSIGALIAETVEPRYRGMAMGGYNSAIYFGLMVGSLGLGPVIEAVGFGGGFALTGAVNLPFIAVFVWLIAGYTRSSQATEA